VWFLILTVGWVWVLGLLVGWIKKDTTEIIGVVSQTNSNSITIEDRDNPYLISSMQKRKYDSEVRTESIVKESEKAIFYKVSFVSDQLKEYALLVVPKGIAPKNGWPVVVVNHGYIKPTDYSTEKSYINTSSYYASQGYVVVKPDYRGHDGSEGEAETVIARINYAVYVLNLLAGVKKLKYVDSERIFMYGHSMGGDVTLRVLETCPNCVKAATLWAPAVTDWPESFLYFARKNPSDHNRVETRQREIESNFVSEEYPMVSTLENLDSAKVKMIIHHGTNDQSVPYEWSKQLDRRLNSLNKPHEFYTYTGDNHDISNNWIVALGRDVSFFESTN
jgi:dipeptidyl aminopeptidase/acylaminoacyl peptidase